MPPGNFFMVLVRCVTMVAHNSLTETQFQANSALMFSIKGLNGCWGWDLAPDSDT